MHRRCTCTGDTYKQNLQALVRLLQAASAQLRSRVALARSSSFRCVRSCGTATASTALGYSLLKKQYSLMSLRISEGTPCACQSQYQRAGAAVMFAAAAKRAQQNFALRWQQAPVSAMYTFKSNFDNGQCTHAAWSNKCIISVHPPRPRWCAGAASGAAGMRVASACRT
jgi:hypothetical protein